MVQTAFFKAILEYGIQVIDIITDNVKALLLLYILLASQEVNLMFSLDYGKRQFVLSGECNAFVPPNKFDVSQLFKKAYLHNYDTAGCTSLRLLRTLTSVEYS